MLIGFMMVAICVLAIWYGRDSREHSIHSEEEVLATYGMIWQKPDDQLAHELAAELLTARQTRHARLIATTVDEQDDTRRVPTLLQQSA